MSLKERGIEGIGADVTKLPNKNDRRFIPSWVSPTITAMLMLVVWEFAVRLFDVAEYILPSPSRVAVELWEERVSLWSNALITGQEILIGFGLAVIFSLPAAMIITSFPWIEKAFYPLLVLSQTIPKTAIAPLFVVWFGFSPTSKILMAFLISFFPILVDAIVGLRSITPESRDLLRSMGASRVRIMMSLRLPASLPYVFTGLKVAITLAVVGAIVGEFVGSTEGLGYQLLQANSSLDTPLLFADIVVLSVFGTVLFYAIEFLEKFLIPWHVSQRSQNERPAH